MRRKVPPIDQSVEELRHLLKKEKDVRKRQRIELLYLLRTGQATTRLEVAALWGIHRHMASSWLAIYA